MSHNRDYVNLRALLAQLARTGGDVRHLRLTYPRFCDKDSTVRLETGPTNGSASVARAVQDGVPVCVMRFSTDAVPARAWTTGAHANPVPVEAKLLHKLREENVLIGRWTRNGAVVEAPLLEPPTGHHLAEGEGRTYSPLQALETVRQLITGLAHGELGIPYGMPMTLVGADLVLEVPLPRGVALSVRHEIRPIEHTGENTLASFEVDFIAAGDPIGRCVVTAQLLTKEAYKELRTRKRRDAA